MYTLTALHDCGVKKIKTYITIFRTFVEQHNIVERSFVKCTNGKPYRSVNIASSDVRNPRDLSTGNTSAKSLQELNGLRIPGDSRRLYCSELVYP